MDSNQIGNQVYIYQLNMSKCPQENYEPILVFENTAKLYYWKHNLLSITLDKQFLNIWEIQLITTLLHLDFTQKQISNEGTKGKANIMDNFCQSPKKHLIKIYTPTWHARGFLHRTPYPCPKLTLIWCIWNNRKSTWLSNPLTSSRLTSWAGMLFKVIKSNKKGGNEMLGRDLDNLPLSPALCSGLKQKG